MLAAAWCLGAVSWNHFGISWGTKIIWSHAESWEAPGTRATLTSGEASTPPPWQDPRLTSVLWPGNATHVPRPLGLTVQRQTGLTSRSASPRAAPVMLRHLVTFWCLPARPLYFYSSVSIRSYPQGETWSQLPCASSSGHLVFVFVLLSIFLSWILLYYEIIILRNTKLIRIHSNRLSICCRLLLLLLFFF